MRYVSPFLLLLFTTVTLACNDADPVGIELDEADLDAATLSPEAAELLELRAPHPGLSIARVQNFDDGTTVRRAFSKVFRGRRGALALLRTRDLEPGAYTMWMVVFNQPDACATTPCGETDVAPGTDAEVDVLFLGNRVVGRSGRATMFGFRRVGDISRSVFDALGAPAPGLVNPKGAEIHLIVRYHGPLIPGQVRAQLQTFEGGCTPESSLGLGDGPFPCFDPQFSIHVAP